MRKDILDQAGGLIAFAQYIAEDYFMAKAIADRFARLITHPYNTDSVRSLFFIFLCLRIDRDNEWMKNYIFLLKK